MFKLKQKQTTVKKEFFAGLTTFLAMAYILAVNPGMLSQIEGMDKGAIFTATAIAAIVGTLTMGLLANYPIALAPGMGMNAFFTYTIVMGYGFSWQLGLFSIFISGLCFLGLSLSGIREKVINAIPQDLKYAVGAGIGLFIAFIGFQNAGIVVGGPTLVELGSLKDPAVLLAIVGLVLTIILYIKRVPAAIFIGIIVTSVIGLVTREFLSKDSQLIEKYSYLEDLLPKLPEAIMSLPKAPHIFELFSGVSDGNFGDIKFILTFFLVVFSLLFIDFFDTAGTLVTVGSRAGLINEEGKLVDSDKALLADAAATVVGAVVGTSSTTSYIESLAGVEVGGRTGLTAVFTSLFFFVAIFFYPLFSVITSPVTAPALIFVGILMATQLGKINWEDTAIAVPAFLTIIIMPLAYSIAEGIAVGFLFFPIAMISAKRGKEVSKIMYALSIIFLIYFVITSVWSI